MKELNEYLKSLSKEELSNLQTDKTACMKVVYHFGIPRCDVLPTIATALIQEVEEERNV